jgi:hypothetical protein
LEDAGIATVIIAVRAFEVRMRMMTLPRVLLTPHLMGRPFGPPGNEARQLETINAAINLLETAAAAGTIEALPGGYLPGNHATAETPIR